MLGVPRSNAPLDKTGILLLARAKEAAFNKGVLRAKAGTLQVVRAEEAALLKDVILA